VLHDGSVTHNGFSDTPISDIARTFALGFALSDSVSIDGAQDVYCGAKLKDTLNRGLHHDGKTLRNGQLFHSNKTIEKVTTEISIAGFSESGAGN
jgi:hypothetical protein